MPAQLTVPLMTRWMLAYEERDRDVLWLCRAVPRPWFREGLAARGVSTRWGKLDMEVKPSGGAIEVEISFGRDWPSSVALRLRHPEHAVLADCRAEGADVEQVDADRELIRLRVHRARVHARATFGAR